MSNFIESFKPALPKRWLLLIAALIWTLAGVMLLLKGRSLFLHYHYFFWLRLIIAVTGGILFYILLFSKISFKHTKRIIYLDNDYPCAFSFFDIKSYILMTIMITAGILLRKSGLVAPEYLSVLYLTMGIPLSISAFRFYYYGIFYKEANGIKD